MTHPAVFSAGEALKQRIARAAATGPDHAALWELLGLDVFADWYMPPKGDPRNYTIGFRKETRKDAAGVSSSTIPVRLEPYSGPPLKFLGEPQDTRGSKIQFGLMLDYITASHHRWPLAICPREGGPPLILEASYYYPLMDEWKSANAALEGVTFKPYRWEAAHAGPLRESALAYARSHFGEPDFYRTINVNGYPLEFAYTVQRDLGRIVQQTLSHGLWRWPCGIGRHTGCEMVLAFETPSERIDEDLDLIDFFQELVTQFLLNNDQPKYGSCRGRPGVPIFGEESELCGIMLAPPRFSPARGPAHAIPAIYGGTNIYAIVGMMNSEIAAAIEGGEEAEHLLSNLDSNPAARTVISPWREWRLSGGPVAL